MPTVTISWSLISKIALWATTGGNAAGLIAILTGLIGTVQPVSSVSTPTQTGVTQASVKSVDLNKIFAGGHDAVDECLQNGLVAAAPPTTKPTVAPVPVTATEAVTKFEANKTVTLTADTPYWTAPRIVSQGAKDPPTSTFVAGSVVTMMAQSADDTYWYVRLGGLGAWIARPK